MIAFIAVNVLYWIGYGYVVLKPRKDPMESVAYGFFGGFLAFVFLIATAVLCGV